MYTIWGRPNCVWCNKAKEELEYNIRVPFKYIELTPENINEFQSLFPGVKTVPQIIDDEGIVIGGYDKLMERFS